MEERNWFVSTTGYGITAVTDAGLEYMAERFLDDLSEGNYAAAFSTFAELCDDFITQARTGEPYDADNLPQEPFHVGGSLAIALAAGFVVSLIVTGIMRGGLKTVHSQPAADHYVKRQHAGGKGNGFVPLPAYRPQRKAEGEQQFGRFQHAYVVFGNNAWRRGGKF